MGIRCIALDLDGTTLDSQGRLSEGNRCALERAIKEGIHIVIASGRAFDSLPEEVLEIKGIEYAITSNGAAIYHVPTGKRLHGYTLSEQSVRKILEVTEGKEVVYETFIEGKAYADSAYVEDPLKYGATEKGVSYIQRTRQREENISEFILRHIRILDSIDIVVPNGEMKNHVWSLLEKNVPDIYLTSSVPRLIEISDRNAGKHSGIRYITELLGLRQEEVAAFGNADNDCEMLMYAGYAAAVENATPACRKAADRIVKGCDEDGVAQGIYEILAQNLEEM